MQTAERAVRAAVNERTLPWMDDGTRILKGAAFLAFTESMAEPIRGFDAAVEAFIAAYPEIKYEARRRLGDAFADGDFPSQGKLRDRFGVRLTYLPVPSSEDFRVQLAADEIATVRRNAEDALRGTVNDAVRALLDRLREPVAHMATRLRLFRRRSNGKTEHPFRDTLVENVRAIVRIAPMLNLMDDPRIAEICADIERHLGRIAVQDGQRMLRDRLLDDAFRFEDLLLRATGQTFCQISTAANTDRIALTNAIRRTYPGGI